MAICEREACAKVVEQLGSSTVIGIPYPERSLYLRGAQQHLCSLEAGKNSPSLTTMRRIAAALGHELSEILDLIE